MKTEPSRKPVSLWKMALGWFSVVAVSVGAAGFWLFVIANDRSADESLPGSDTPEASLGLAIFMFAAGTVFLILGVAAYLLVLFTNCFRWDFTKPMWSEMKMRIYLANIFIPLLVMMGMGFMLSSVLTPTLVGMGLSPSIAQLLPVLGCIGLLQIVLVWFVIWGPLETRLIRSRLLAKGISEQQLNNGYYVGLSDPGKSSLKKLTCVEDEMGMLWFGPDQLIFWGDTEDFAIARADLLEVERSMDAGSTSALSGTAHVIVRVRQPNGGERRIRLHCEGVMTLGRKRSAMNELAERIAAWRTAVAKSPPPVPA